MKLLEDERFPVGEHLWIEIVPTANLRLVGDSGQKIENGLGLELWREKTSSTRHGKCSLTGPVLTSILVHSQGRTSFLYPTWIEKRVRWKLRNYPSLDACDLCVCSGSHLLPIFLLVQHFAGVAAVVGADDAVLGHVVDEAGGAAIADAEGALQ